MKQEVIGIIRITADSGKFLTQASDEIDIMDRIHVKTLNLSPNDSPSNWKEISDREAAMIDYEQRSKLSPSTPSGPGNGDAD